MNTIKVQIFQDESRESFDKQHYLERTIMTNDTKTEFNIKLFALYELYCFYQRVEIQKIKLKEFDLRRPIKFTVFWNHQFHNTYFLTYRQNAHLTLSNDFSILIKCRHYILRAENDHNSIIKTANFHKKNKTLPENQEPINVEKVFNYIDFTNKGFAKFPTPILYTGMTN